MNSAATELEAPGGTSCYPLFHCFCSIFPTHCVQTKVTYWLAFIVRLAVELYGISTGDIKEDVGCSYSCFVFILLPRSSGQNQFVSYMANNTLTV
jgi:hypothetical protein